MHGGTTALQSHDSTALAASRGSLDIGPGWHVVRLEDVATYVNGYAFKPSDWGRTGRPIIRIQNLNDATKPYNYFSGEIDGRYSVQPGDVLISWSASLGAYLWSGPEAWLNQHIFKAIIREEVINRDYFYWAMRYEIEHIAESAHGSTMQHVTQKVFVNSTIPLPPLSEQRAIARTLRAVQDAIQARRRELELERERKAALMQHLFTKGTRGEPTKQTDIGEMPESWVQVPVRDIASVAYGLTVNQQRRSSPATMPYLTVANVTRGELRLDEVKQIGVVADDALRYRLQPGDVLLVEGNGNPKLLGSAAVWHGELPLALHQNHLIRARPHQERILPEWLMNYINSDAGRAQLLGQGKTSSGLNSINSQVVANLLVPVPSLDEQRDVIGVVRACGTRIQCLEREVGVLEELFRALLEELMTGRLSALPLVEHDEAEVRA